MPDLQNDANDIVARKKLIVAKRDSEQLRAFFVRRSDRQMRFAQTQLFMRQAEGLLLLLGSRWHRSQLSFLPGISSSISRV